MSLDWINLANDAEPQAQQGVSAQSKDGEGGWGQREDKPQVRAGTPWEGACPLRAECVLLELKDAQPWLGGRLQAKVMGEWMGFWAQEALSYPAFSISGPQNGWFTHWLMQKLKDGLMGLGLSHPPTLPSSPHNTPVTFKETDLLSSSE